MDRVVLAGRDQVQAEDDQDEDERCEPRVLECQSLPPTE